MKSKKKKLTKSMWRRQHLPLLGFLIFSMALAVTIVACKKDSTTPTDNTVKPPEFVSDAGTSAITAVFESVGKGAMGEIGNVGMSWALSALGLAGGSPDYTQQFENIDNDLKVISAQLSAMELELEQLGQDITILNCNSQQTGINGYITSIITLQDSYNAMMSIANDTSTILADSTMNKWVEQVLDEGVNGMKKVLAGISQAMFVAGDDGIIPTCIKALDNPKNGTFDSTYYLSVQTITNYYYYYQALGLSYLNEAYHYKAWVAAGKPNSTSYSADSIANVCSHPDGRSFCIDAASYTNTVYNSLLQQFSPAGAPYSDDNFLMEYDSTNPMLWVKSLEDFTLANSDNCPDPLTSANPCGITAGKYNEPLSNPQIYRTYGGWIIASNDVHLKNLLAGWTSGTVGDYLENSFGFKNMKNKIVMGNNNYSIELSWAQAYFNFIGFFDTDMDKSFGLNQPTYSTNDYNLLAPKSPLYVNNNYAQKPCPNFYNYQQPGWLPESFLQSRNNFYIICARSWVTAAIYSLPQESCAPLEWCQGGEPGWLANIGTVQYRWPITPIAKFTCTSPYTPKNTGGIWSMCGSNFIAFLEANIPIPPSCNDPSILPLCTQDSKTIAKAKRVFEH